MAEIGEVIGGRFEIVDGPIAVEYFGDHDDCRNHGQHYHCARCGDVSGMVGHARREGGFTCDGEVLDRALAEITRLRQGLWDCAAAAGADHDGDATPKHMTYPDIVEHALTEVRELAERYEEIISG